MHCFVCLKFYLRLLLILLCVEYPAFALTKNLTEVTTPTFINLPPANSVTIEGDVNVQIASSQSGTKAQIIGFPQDINITVHNSTLTIVSRKFFNSDKNVALVKVWLPQLLSLNLHGYGHVRVSHLNANEPLSVASDGGGHISLEGMINLQQLWSNGSATLFAHWINSKSLSFNLAGSTHVKLAGRVGVLHGTVADRSQLNAAFLRTQTTFISAFDNATANILAIDSLNAFATEQSHIYYFKVPEHIVAATADAGNVLQLAFWN